MNRIAPLVLVTTLVVPGIADALRPKGGEFQVNTHTPANQAFSSAAYLEDGSFVLVWSSETSGDTDAGDSSIQLGRFASDGTRIGADMQVNAYTSGSQQSPHVVANGGTFLVVWSSDGSSGTDDDSESIQGRLFSSTGAALTGQVQLNSYTTLSQSRPRAAVNAHGFVVTWESEASQEFDPDVSIQARRLSLFGLPVGADSKVNSFTEGDQSAPDIAALDAGMIVVWESAGSPGDDDIGRAVVARPLDAFGQPVGADFQVNTITANDQHAPSVAAAGDGFLTVWQGYGSISIRGRRITSSGAPSGSAFFVNSYTQGQQFLPRIAASSTGEALVTWTLDDDGDGFGVAARLIDANGNQLGSELQVNTSTLSYQLYSTAAAGPDNEYIVSWSSLSSTGTDSSALSIQARKFFAGIFADGFESGDSTGWSSTSP